MFKQTVLKEELSIKAGKRLINQCLPKQTHRYDFKDCHVTECTNAGDWSKDRRGPVVAQHFLNHLVSPVRPAASTLHIQLCLLSVIPCCILFHCADGGLVHHSRFDYSD